tara:strand:- start:2685 stop:3059 length:375 start_codon:yes stop_codon:yes gene_type:complete
MALPYNSIASQPQGLETATINSVAYVVDSVDMSTIVSRTISRTDANGDRADFLIRDGSDQITGSMTLQRALTTTVLPDVGTVFTYDFDRSGTASSIVVSDVKVSRSGEDFDTFDIGVTLVTYQA